MYNEDVYFVFQKLRLFSAESGALFSTESDIDSLMKQELIFSGSSVILEYVDNNVDCLEDLTLYKIS